MAEAYRQEIKKWPGTTQTVLGLTHGKLFASAPEGFLDVVGTQEH